MKYLIIGMMFKLTMIWSLAAADKVPASEYATMYDLLDRYCLKCHDSDTLKGGVNLEFDPDGKDPISDEPLVWERVVEVLHMKAMPPPDKKQLTAAEAKSLEKWITDGLKRETARTAGDPGDVPTRRLNKAEYRRIVADSTGLRQLDVIDDLPQDTLAGEGFANVATALRMNTDHLSAYVHAAHAIAERAAFYRGRGIIFHADSTANDDFKKIKQRVSVAAGLVMDQILQKGLVPDKPLNRLAYAAACWRYRESPTLQKQGLTALAKKLRLNPDFLHNWWAILTSRDQFRKNLVIWSMLRRWDEIPSATDPVSHDSQLPSMVEQTLKELVADVSEVGKNARDQSIEIGMRNGDTTPAQTIETSSLPGEYFYLTIRDLGDEYDPVHLHTQHLRYYAWEKDKGSGNGGWKRYDYIPWLKGEISRRTKNKVQSDDEGLQARPGLLTDFKEMSKRFEKQNRMRLKPHEVIRLPVPPKASKIECRLKIVGGSKDGLFTLQVGLLDRDPGDVPYILGPFVKIRWDNKDAADSILPIHTKWKNFHWSMNNYFPHTKADRQRKLERVWRFADGSIVHSTESLTRSQVSKRISKSLAQELEDIVLDFQASRTHDWVNAEKKWRKMLDVPENADPEAVTDRDAREKILAIRANHKHALSLMVDRRERVLTYLREIAAKAWGRAPVEREQKRFESLVPEWDREHKDPHHDLRKGIAYIFCAPQFLLRQYSSEPTDTPTNTAFDRLSNAALSQRMASMLWVSNPDQKLRELAAKKSLRQDDVVEAEVKRMLKSSKVAGMVSEFFGNWFGFKGFRDINTVDPERFPSFTADLRLNMERQASAFCMDLIREDRPVTELITGKYTFINEALAKHYQTDPKRVQGNHFRRVDVSRWNRGGILGMGFFYVSTSYSLRTSAVLRGDWVLTRILGRHTPPPPPGVPPLPEDDASGTVSMDEHLRKHREDPRCAACHDHIDPLGIPLEGYDSVGRVRTKDGGGRPVSTSAEIHGQTVVGLAGLHGYIKERQDEFLHLLCRKLVGYGLGRPVRIGDNPLIERMKKNLKENDMRFSVAVQTLVSSKQFQYRRKP